MGARTREFQDGAVVDSRYRILSLLGAGGMGSVYEVEHTQLDKRFVLKALHREYTDREDLVSRLRIEWLSLAKLEHPNIVNVTDAGTSAEGVAFFVMEKLHGETLSVRLKRLGGLSVDESLRIGREILDGLAAAHRIGVVHRDVKPANVFITEAGITKLLDFGIAKVMTNKTITAHGVAIGTPRYMSPEQARGVQVDSRADIYAAGLLLYEMLAGRGPFHAARDTGDLLHAQLFEEPVPLSEVVHRVDRELEDLCVSMLAKSPDERPDSAAALVKRLAAIRRRLQSQSEPAPGSTQTTVPGALAQTSPAISTASGASSASRASRASRSAVGSRSASNAHNAATAATTEPLRQQSPVETRTSQRSTPGDSLVTHTKSQTPYRRAARKSSRAVWIAIGAVAAVAVGAVAWRSLTPGADASNQAPPAVAASAPALAPSPAPVTPPHAPAPKVKLTIESIPSGAEVYRQPANVRVGSTPHDALVAATDGQVVFTLVKSGYVTEEIALSASEDSRHEATLKPLRRRKPKRKARPTPAPEPEAVAEEPPEPPSTSSGKDRTIDPWQ